MKRIAIFLIVVALIAGMVGCEPTSVPPAQYDLTISSTTGGSVVVPGEGTFAYEEGTVVNLVAGAEEGYQFANWTGDIDTITSPNSATTIIAIDTAKSVTANFVPLRCSLTIESTEGGAVTTPGEGTFTYDYGTVVDLVAEAEEGYEFAGWMGDVGSVADINGASTTITVDGGYTITASFAIEICDWYDLDAIRNNLGSSYVLMNDIDSATAGYAELASATANQRKGWQPIGSVLADPIDFETLGPVAPFTGILDGRGYEIRDLFVNRPSEHGVGLFGFVGEGGVVENLGVVNAEVSGYDYVGGLMGYSWGAVHSSYSTGSVTGDWGVGGLVGWSHWTGTVSNSYCIGSVVGERNVAGLVGVSEGKVSKSYFAGSVTGGGHVGGLVGSDYWGVVCNSHYDYDEVLINGKKIITTGALFHEDFEEWLANDRFLDVNERLSKESGYYLINNVADFKELLAFGQDDSLRFRLESDLDLGNETDLYIPYLAGEFDGNGREISNVSLNLGFVSDIGLFGYVAPGGAVTRVGVKNVNIIGASCVGALVGDTVGGAISNSYAAGSVTGNDFVGGLVGVNSGTLNDSYFTGSVTGSWGVRGLVGKNVGIVSNSYYDYDEVLINGQKIITIGALFHEDFEEWLANDTFLDINERLSKESGCYLINSVVDFKELLAFGQDDSFKFRLENDLDLRNEANFYIPYLAGQFDGNGHKISNLSVNFDFIVEVGLFGSLAHGGEVSQVGVENVNITGASYVGGLVGHNLGGTVSKSYSTGRVTGGGIVGGLAGENWGTVSNSYSGVSVTAEGRVGGLIGWNNGGTVRDSYAVGSVTGHGDEIGGLVGRNNGRVSSSYSVGGVTGGSRVGGLIGINVAEGLVTNSFWDKETSEIEESDGGVGKSTTEMRGIPTFKGAAWSIIAVAHGATNPAYTWNIVDGQTYPFLSWQSVS